MKLYKWLYIVHVCVYALNPSHFPNGKKKHTFREPLLMKTSF